MLTPVTGELLQLKPAEVKQQPCLQQTTLKKFSFISPAVPSSVKLVQKYLHLKSDRPDNLYIADKKIQITLRNLLFH